MGPQLMLLEGNPGRRRRNRSGRFVRTSHRRRRVRRNGMAVANPRRRHRYLSSARRVVRRYRRNPLVKGGKVGASIKTAAIGMVGMVAVDAAAPLIQQLLGGVTGAAGSVIPGVKSSSILDENTTGAVISLLVVARSKPGGAVHTAASFALAKKLYDMFGPQLKGVISGIKIPGLGAFPMTNVPAYVSESVTGRRYATLNGSAAV